MSKTYALLVLILLPFHCFSQFSPAEGSVLNFRIVGFEVAQQKKSCVIEIAEGNFQSEDSFKNAVMQTAPVIDRRAIIELPGFGKQYTWRTVAGTSQARTHSAFHHFSTGYCPEVDTDKFRLTIIDSTGKLSDGYVFCDFDRTIYDLKGRPVWYLPATDELSGLHPGSHPGGISGMSTTDMKLTPEGTIIFLLRGKAYEVGYDGSILWRAPENIFSAGGSGMQYHHELMRLSNGDYMVLGIENALMRKNWLPGNKKNLITGAEQSGAAATDTNYRLATFGVLIEYAPDGKIVWLWKSSKYFAESDLVHREASFESTDCGMHENAFCFDTANKVIYLSMKLNGRILKIEYPSGKVLETYGEIYQPGTGEKRNGPFFGQHACKVSKTGDLYLLNNNVLRDTSAMPEVVAYHESAPGNLKKVWEFRWPQQDVDNMKNDRITFESGGNVELLSDSNVLIYMPGSLGKLYITNHENQILWSATAEWWDAGENQWKKMRGYRMSYCTRKSLEALIWHSKPGQTKATQKQPH